LVWTGVKSAHYWVAIHADFRVSTFDAGVTNLYCRVFTG